MLTRGFYDAVSLWPMVFWPIMFSSCLYAWLRLCRLAREKYGCSPLDGDTRADKALIWGVIPAAFAFEVAAHVYLIYVAGYLYILTAIPIYVLGWVLLPYVLDGFRPAMTLLALGHAVFAAAFLVLMGFFDVGVLRALNSDIYGLLTGVPANI